MVQASARWHAIPQSPVQMKYARIERDGVAVLCASLRGTAENTPEGVGRVKDALDEAGATIEPDVEVATLDVTAFANASDDACGILTGVFGGLPCCWITHEWEQQQDGGGDAERWDLPASGRMAGTTELAIARVVGWRRTGSYTVRSEESRWVERGLLVRHVRAEMEDLWYRNRCVERTIFHRRHTLVQLPWPDRTGEPHEALRRRARLVYEDGRLVEADFNPSSTQRQLSDDWVESVCDLAWIKTLGLRGTSPLEADLHRALAALPSLETLEIDRHVLSEIALAALRRERPNLAIG